MSHYLGRLDFSHFTTCSLDCSSCMNVSRIKIAPSNPIQDVCVLLGRRKMEDDDGNEGCGAMQSQMVTRFTVAKIQWVDWKAGDVRCSNSRPSWGVEVQTFTWQSNCKHTKIRDQNNESNDETAECTSTYLIGRERLFGLAAIQARPIKTRL